MELMMGLVALITMTAGGFVLLYGIAAFGATLFFDMRWNWARGVELKRSVKLGWNVGEPPEGVWVLVRNNIKRPTISERIGDWDTARWAVMKRRGSMMWSQTEGYGMPIKNVIGWLEVVDDSGEPAVCACGDQYAPRSYGAGFMDANGGVCENCDMERDQ